jgi:hypothetical protein
MLWCAGREALKFHLMSSVRGCTCMRTVTRAYVMITEEEEEEDRTK